MAMTVKRRRDTSLRRVILQRVADIPGGVAVNTKDLGGDYLFEGTPISKPEGGMCHVVKTAKLYADLASDDTAIKVEKGHHFKTGDIAPEVAALMTGIHLV